MVRAAAHLYNGAGFELTDAEQRVCWGRQIELRHDALDLAENRLTAGRPAARYPPRRPMPVPSRPSHIVTLLCALVALVALGGCGRPKKALPDASRPQVGVKGAEQQGAEKLGFPVVATKNTTRVGGADATADAAGVALAVYPGGAAQSRPAAVTLVDRGDWRAAIAASVFMSSPIGAPILFADGNKLPQATRDALATLRPTGSKAAGGAQIIRVGNVARPAGYRTTDVNGRTPAALGRAIDAVQSAARKRTGSRVLILSAEDPGFAMPAAGYAAKSGDTVLFVNRTTIPPDTRAALKAHQKPKIYVLGSSKVIAPKVTRKLRKLGNVTRIGGQDPVSNAIAFARYADGAFGWGVANSGHGLVFTRANADPAVAAAAAPLSASGTYGPLLLLSGDTALDSTMSGYLLDIEPGYEKDPVLGVYNRGWIVGDTEAVTARLQAQIDRLLEIMPVNAKATP